jgi:hypothetical protein
MNKAKSPTNVTPASEPVWPLPKLNGHAPVLLVHDENDPGVELAYERRWRTRPRDIRCWIVSLPQVRDERTVHPHGVFLSPTMMNHAATARSRREHVSARLTAPTTNHLCGVVT